MTATGSGRERDEAIVAEFKRQAQRLGFERASARCGSTVQIVVTPDVASGLRDLARSNKAALSTAEARRSVADASRKTVVTWVRSGSPRGDDGDDDDARRGDAPGGLTSGLLLVAAGTAADKTPIQLADYAVFRLLGNTTETLPSFGSIQRLFAGDWAAAGGLTEFDMIVLQTIYHAPAHAPSAKVIDDIVAAVDRAIARDGPGRGGMPASPGAAQLLTDEPGSPPPPAAVAEAVTGEASNAPPEWRSDVVVTARKDGPAMWRVRKGMTTLVLLGTVAPLPLDLKWNDWRVSAALRRSRLMLVSAEPEPHLVLMRAWTPDAARRLHQPNGRRLTDELSENERERLAAAAAFAGQEVGHYDGLRPAAAALLLNADWRAHAGLANTGLVRQVGALARKSHVRIRYIPQISLLTTIDELPRLGDAAQGRCFDHLLDNIEREHDRASLQARDWATGDLGALRGSYLSPANCSDVIAYDAAKRSRAVGLWTGLLLQALNQPGQVFALIDMTDLLRPDGILARLTAAGAVVDVPPDESP